MLKTQKAITLLLATDFRHRLMVLIFYSLPVFTGLGV
jgi:hypothetical protein